MSGFVPPGPGQPPEEPAGSPPQQPPTYGSLPSYGEFRGPSPDYDGGADAEASSSRKMAGWALGLSFCFFIPLAPLAAIGLAITALVQGSRATRDGRRRNHGTGMAIAALPIATVNIVVTIVLIATGVVADLGSDDDAERDEEGQVIEPTDIPALNLRVGDCANDPDLAELGDNEKTEIREIEAVPCSVLHDFEAFHRFALPDGGYPGGNAVLREAERRCLRAARTFLGGPKGTSTLRLAYYYPTALSWRTLDDRDVLCVIGDPGQKTVGSLKGSGRP